MSEYIRFIIFFFLGIWENIINFIFSLIRVYPAIDIQFKYWGWTMDNSKKKFLNKLKKTDGKNIS
jgi:hypothetical protein